MKTLVLGLGNPLLSDDAAGIHVARALRRRLSGCPDIEVDEDYCGGLRLMERLVDYDDVILVDAATTGSPPGTVRRLRLADLPTRGSDSAHGVGLATALEVGRLAGAHLPTDERIALIAIESGDTSTIGETCTSAVEAAKPRAIDMVLATIEAWGREREE